MENKNLDQNNLQFENVENNDLIKFFNFSIRNKKIIGSFGILFFLIFCLFSLTQRRVWQGQFQIVLDKEKSSKLRNVLSSFGNFGGGFGFGLDANLNSDLQTEVGILNSPSILMPIFDFVNSNWKIKNPEKDELKFYSWKENLDINLQKNTSILDIAYSDENKEIIIPVLTMISDAYQDYSGKNERENLAVTRKYLIEQIKIYKIKSQNSIKLAQEFAMDQNLTLIGTDNNLSNTYSTQDNIGSLFGRGNLNLPSLNLQSKTNFALSNIDIENVRARAANEIKQIDIQIRQISDIEDPKELQYIGFLNSIAQEDLTKKLKDLETEIANRRLKYKENDRGIVNLIRQRDITAKLIKERSIGFLEAKKIIQKAKMEAAIRPKGVLIKYRELLREAEREEKTLFGLENQLNQVNLLSARVNMPWELITKPTLLDFPVSMSRKKIGILGLFFGLILGYIFSIYKEKNSNNLFENLDLEDTFDSPILENKFENKLQNLYLIENIKNTSLKKINLITKLLPVNYELKDLEKSIRSFNPDIKILNNNFVLSSESQISLLILLSGNIDKNASKQIKRILDNAGIKLFGILIIY